MRRIAAVLAFLLALGMLGAWVSMNSDDGHNAAASIKSDFDALNAGDRFAFDASVRRHNERKNEETIYGIFGLVCIIGGFALWPRGENSEDAGTGSLSLTQ